MKKQQATEALRDERIRQLNDILARYELALPFNAEALFMALEELDNPYDLITSLKDIELRIAAEYGNHVAVRVMPEISSLHAQLERPALAGLSYRQLETVLKNAQMVRKAPADRLSYCQAVPDMQSMLKHIQENAPTLTKKLRQLNRRSVAEINARFIEPQQTIHNYGDKIFTDRDEQEVWKLRFLRSLAQTCYMTYVRKGHLKLANRGARWLESDDITKVNSLFREWCEVADWGFWHDWDSDIADCLHFDQLMLYQVVLAIDLHYGKIQVSKLDTVCATLCGVTNEPDEYGNAPFRYKSYFLVLRPFMYLGLVVNEKKPSKSEYDLPKDVLLTDYGKWQLSAAIREELSWIKARSI